MLLGIPGDNTYSNYGEAQRAFWRGTVLPLVHRMAKAFSMWLAPAYGDGVSLRPDLDQVEGLSAEREALWARIERSSFLTLDEKRAAVGYGPAPREEDAPEPADDAAPSFGSEVVPFVKYNPDQPRVSAGNADGGQWTDSGGGGSSGGVRVAQAATGTLNDAGEQESLVHLAQVEGSPGRAIDILEEDSLGGHTFERHVNKPDEYLRARILGSRRNIPYIVSYGEKRAGSFTSLEAANKLVSATISQNLPAVEAFAAEQFPYLLPEMYVFADFASATGYEAYSPNERAQPVIRETYGVTVHLVRSRTSKKGYYVFRAFPANRD